MASFTIYDPKTKVFRALETAPESDLPFDQILLINILIELRVIATFMNNEGEPRLEETEDIRQSIVNEI